MPRIGTTSRNAIRRFITVTSPASPTVAENAAFSQNLTTDRTVTWAKVGGADQALFTLAGSTLSMTAKDFEAPADANADNVYEVLLKATETTFGTEQFHWVLVRVTDVGGA